MRGTLDTKRNRRPINKCPATIFAIKRTLNVIGRIILLISSIKKSNLTKAKGVPSGIKCIRNLFKELPRENIRNVTQIPKEKNTT